MKAVQKYTFKPPLNFSLFNMLQVIVSIVNMNKFQSSSSK